MFNSTKKTSRDGVMVLRRNGMLLNHFQRNRDAILPHLKPWLLHNIVTTGIEAHVSRNKFLYTCVKEVCHL
jgi:hypothetical protein